MKQFHIGTSGFSYASWKNKFYPEGIPTGKWLEYYCTRFNSVELNSTFYKFPLLSTMSKYYDRTPVDFIFSIKAHKIITHSLRMKNAKNKTDEFLSVVYDGLREKAACVLFQLPPSFKYSEENLDNILESLPHKPYIVVEFRHESWWNEIVVDALQKNHLSFCNVNYPHLPESYYKTTNQFYLRMHGVPELFVSPYSDEKLESIAEHIPLINADPLFIYFNNTTYEAGYSNALTLKQFTENS